MAPFMTHFGIGAAVFFSVLKFFEEIEKSLSAETKLEIAVWLLRIPGKTAESWRSIFPKIFNMVFGEKHFSWKCFRRSCEVTAIVTFIVMLARTALSPIPKNALSETVSFVLLFVSGVFGSSFPDYMSLWKTRQLLNLTRRLNNPVADFFFLAVDIIASFALAVCAAFIGTAFLMWMGSAMFQGTILPFGYTVERVWSLFRIDLWTEQLPAVTTVWFIPALFGRLWIVSYVGCGLLLRVTHHHLRTAFEWFKRSFDVENSPLRSIGLVAGVCMAVGYWLLAAIHLFP
jgi:hypothetical protein